jgi:hypothetical protein
VNEKSAFPRRASCRTKEESCLQTLHQTYNLQGRSCSLCTLCCSVPWRSVYWRQCEVIYSVINFIITIYLFTVCMQLLYTKNLCFIEEHYMFRHISAIIRWCQFSILTLNILKSYAQRSPNTFTFYMCCNNDKLIKMTNLLKKLH